MCERGDAAPTFVKLIVKTEGSQMYSERKFPVTNTIREVKQKLELLTGASANSMRLELRDSEDVKVIKVLTNDDNLRLDAYPICDGLVLHVSDPLLNTDEFKDISKVQKVELSEEAYNRRNNTARAFLQKNGLGRFNEDAQERARRLEEEKARKQKEILKVIHVGNRCQVVGIPGQPRRRGTVAYVGEVDFKPGVWVGVHYDLPLGKNDGSVAGKRYFECPPNYGGFVRPADLVIGNFLPEGDCTDGDEIDLDEEL
uniref:Putative tubulin-specific chaperone b n=1 Tax=Hyalomma excavatum TaxID=257692 RepID=A0A131XIM6_9ACAR